MATKKSCVEAESTTTHPETQEAIDVVYDSDQLTERLQEAMKEENGMSSYYPLLPLKDTSNMVTMGEGNTPLLHAERLGGDLGLPHLYIKDEGANPTGVFKDRGSMVELTKAKELGAEAVCCASTGNMAASVAAYAAAAQLPCYVVVPEGTPIGKLAQSVTYGAHIIQVRGTYADCVPLAAGMAERHNCYLAGDYAFRMEGHRTTAYEIYWQLGGTIPDVVITPIGCGTHLSGIAKGFEELKKAGIVEKMPRMIGVQPSSVDTIVRALEEGSERYVPIETPSSIASAVSIGVPQDDRKVLRAIRESGGCGEVAMDEEILAAQKELGSKESLFVEPSSAIPVAVLPHLLEKGLIDPSETVVCIATGTGLKDPKTAVSRVPDPPVIEPRQEEIDRYFSMKLYAITGSSAKNEILFSKAPTLEELAEILRTEFTVEPDGQVVQQVLSGVAEFLEKGKEVTRADTQNLLEIVLNEFSLTERVLEITDFHVTDSKHSAAEAKVTVKFHGEEKVVTGTGDGMFDAIIHGVRLVTENDGLDIHLTDYNVAIDTPGAAAVVKVAMTMEDKDAHSVIATAVSPDVIVASVQAYEKGYNLLYWKHHSHS